MNENNIQATITLTLTREQLLTLLTSAPNVQTAVQTPEPVQVAPPPQMPGQTQQTYTVEQIGRAARPLVEGGRQQELVALLAEFGVTSVAALPEEARAAFVQRIRAMGAQI